MHAVYVTRVHYIYINICTQSTSAVICSLQNLRKIFQDAIIAEQVPFFQLYHLFLASKPPSLTLILTLTHPSPQKKAKMIAIYDIRTIKGLKVNSVALEIDRIVNKRGVAISIHTACSGLLCNSVGRAILISCEGRGFNSHPNQSFFLSLPEPISITRAHALGQLLDACLALTIAKEVSRPIDFYDS